MNNLRGSLLMILAMATFALEDAFIKGLSRSGEGWPTGQILAYLGLGGGLVFWARLRAKGQRLWTRDLLHPTVLLRNGGEMLGTVGFVTAVALSPVSTATAIFQVTPLAVVAGAALILGEPVGWRRWTAIGVGFIGVLMVVQPGAEGFTPMSLFALLAVVGLGTRDLATRRVPDHIGTEQISGSAYFTVALAGALLMLALGQVPAAITPRDTGFALATIVLGVTGYTALVNATRFGDVSVVTPFRFTRLLFALLIGYSVFGERPNALALAGAALIVTSGIYAMIRETLANRRARASLPPQDKL